MPLFKLQLCYMKGPLHPIQLLKNLKAAAPVLLACSFILSLSISVWVNRSGPAKTHHWKRMAQTDFITGLGTISYASRTQVIEICDGVDNKQLEVPCVPSAQLQPEQAA